MVDWYKLSASHKSSTQEHHTVYDEHVDLEDNAEAEGKKSEHDGRESQAEDDAGADEDAWSMSSNRLKSDAEAFTAQLAAERPLWTKKKLAPSHKSRAPPMYANIRAPRSAKAAQLLDKRVYSSSPEVSDSLYKMDEGMEVNDEDKDVKMPEDDDDKEKEWMETIRRQAACAQANKALSPLLPPTTTTSEQPQWKPAKQKLGTASASAKTMVLSAFSNTNAAPDATSNNKEPDAAVEDHPHPPVYGEGPDVQPPTAYSIIQPDVSETLPCLEAKLTFDNVFPNTITLAQDVHWTLIEVTELLGYTGLVSALGFNNQISAPVAAIVRQRMSTYRGGVKKHADTHTLVFFHLKKGCEEHVKALFNFMSYAYVHTWNPTSGKLDVTWCKPYGHDIIPAMLHQCFFNGQSSLASNNTDRFTSSLNLRPNNKEIPIPMLAFICTAVHASLTEWRSGAHPHVPFSVNAFLDVYNEHKLVLNGIKKKNIRAFHKMMHNLYHEARYVLDHYFALKTLINPCSCCSGAAPTNNEAATAAANQALAQVNIANMDVD